MPRQTGVVFKRKGRKNMYDVYCVIIKQGKNDMEKVKQTSEARKTSVSTVRCIINEAKGSGLLIVLGTPGKKRSGKKKVTGMDSFVQSVIKRCNHNNYITSSETPYRRKASKNLKKI